MLLDIATNQENKAIFCGNRPGVEWNLLRHLDQFLVKIVLVDSEDLDVLLVPLEGVEAGHDLALVALPKRAFDVVVNAELSLD